MVTKKTANYLKAKEPAEYVLDNPEIMPFKHLKKIETEFYKPEKAKEIKDELNHLINSKEREPLREALHRNKIVAQNKSEKDSDFYDPNDDWDAEA